MGEPEEHRALTKKNQRITGVYIPSDTAPQSAVSFFFCETWDSTLRSLGFHGCAAKANKRVCSYLCIETKGSHFSPKKRSWTNGKAWRASL